MTTETWAVGVGANGSQRDNQRVIYTEVKRVTPEFAGRLLATRREHERPIVQNRVHRWAEAMQRDEWRPTSHILIDRDGRLLNGQHRLLAQVLSGCTVEYIFSYGHDPADHQTIDIGAPRSLKNHLETGGVGVGTDRSRLAPALRMVYTYEQVGIPVHYTGVTTSPERLMAVVDRHPGLLLSVKAYGKRGSRLLLAGTQIAALHYLMSLALPDKATAFIDGLLLGDGLERGNPVLTLRERLLRTSASPTRVLKGPVRVGLTVRAWEAFALGETLGKIPWHPGRLSPERFPRIYGCPIVPEIDKRAKLEEIEQDKAQRSRVTSSPEFRERALSMAEQYGDAVASQALGVPEGTLRSWRYRANG